MSRELPSHLSVPLKRLCETALSFVALHEDNEKRTQAIVQELKEISDKVKELQDETFRTSAIWTGLGGLGAGSGLLTAFFAGVAATGEGAGRMATLAAGGLSLVAAGSAAIAGATVIKANAKKAAAEKESMRTVEQLGKEFMNIVEQQKKSLKEIKQVSDELCENSSILMTTAGAQAKTALSEMEELQRLLRRIFKPPEDLNARNFISELVRQCEKTVDEVAKIKSKLKAFEEK